MKSRFIVLAAVLAATVAAFAQRGQARADTAVQINEKGFVVAGVIRDGRPVLLVDTTRDPDVRVLNVVHPESGLYFVKTADTFGRAFQLVCEELAARPPRFYSRLSVPEGEAVGPCGNGAALPPPYGG